jgi:hypothetical protein
MVTGATSRMVVTLSKKAEMTLVSVHMARVRYHRLPEHEKSRLGLESPSSEEAINNKTER